LKTTIVFGLSSAGLFLLRELANIDVPVYAIGRKDEIGSYSKFGNKFVIESEKEFASFINEMINSINEKPRCYIAGEFFLKLILEKYPGLFNQIDSIQSSNIDVMNVLTTKTLTYKVAKDLGINTPTTYCLEDILHRKYSNKVNYPIILKWNEISIDFNTTTKWKTRIVSEERELSNIYKEISDVDKSKLIFQEYIEGSDISYGGYFVDGRERIGIVVKQLRQHPIGISSYVCEYSGKFAEQARNLANQIIQKLKFSGFAETEFRVCHRTGKLYLLEINPRPWSWIKILKLKYPQFDEILKNPDDPIPPIPVNEDCKWFNLLRDFEAIFISFCQNKRLSFLLKDLSTYRGKKILGVFDWEDQKPFYFQIKKQRRKFL